MKQTIKLKAFALLLIMAACGVMQAQTDNFFRGGDESYENRASVNTPNGGDPGTGLHNQTFGQDVPAPLGSGLLIMAAAGAGYAVARRRRSLRKGTAMLLALALVLGLTQCKKRVETVATNPSEGVHITLTVDDNSKCFINEVTGEVTYTAGDEIYVGYNGKYCGTLTCNGERFEGTITPESTEDPLYLCFYYTGGVTWDAYDLQNLGSFTINYSYQYKRLRTVSTGHSTQPYSPETTSYHCWLRNKCALVKFTLSNPTPDMITMEGANSDNRLKYNSYFRFDCDEMGTGSLSGEIKPYHRYDNEYWAVIPTQPAVSDVIVRIPGFKLAHISLPALEDNAFLTQGININNEPKSDGFTIDNENHTVYFSKGNLQYLGNADGTGTWRFADNQWDWMGDGPSSGTVCQGNVTIPGYTDYNYGSGNDVGSETERDKASARDLFGWGTSGYIYQPYSTGKTNDAAYYGGTTDIAGTPNDWGVYHSPGGLGTTIEGTTDHWRTLTEAEWTKLLNRTGWISTADNYTQNKRLYAAAQVMGTMGLILFPDNWTGRVNGNVVNIYYASNSGYYGTGIKNVFDDTTTPTWAQLEDLGCVFLPGMAMRSGATVQAAVTDGNNRPIGQTYWTGSIYSNNNTYARFAKISGSSSISASATNNSYRYAGMPVRLVKDAN